ncbi:MAG: cryptochrome/photolyase family protein [Oceanospirillales bacterium]|nr:MAG: cryptochrome/photolyase family protein [Oceanospirillales bacterium]
MELRLLLGDQLNAAHSWFKEVDDNVIYLIAEMRQETDYVVHHVQKICAFFTAMEKFAKALQQAGHKVEYLTLDDTQGFEDLPQLLSHYLQHHKVSHFSYQEPDEFRLDQQLLQFCEALTISSSCVDSEHFITPRNAWQILPNHRMEFFYRALRKQHNVLMEAKNKPLGGRWNFDAENRQSLPEKVVIAEPLLFSEDVSGVIERLNRHQVKTLGSISKQTLIWPVTRQASRQLLSHFLEQCLPQFGQYQDAMTERGWSLFHSRLSFSLNSKMLHPMEVIRATENYWHEHQDKVSLAQAEGFIRQILGWREYVRALYWSQMPDYKTLNHLDAERPLPSYFWDGKTKMRCMSHAIQQSLDHAYAHHIQRLMITGNFALLAGIHPDAVDNWYLGIYIDAIEWVEMPNTRGMSQFADGGLIASKPYAASGNYIQRMSHYCKSCHYDVKKKTGEGSCPFNSLYWHFIHRHQAEFETNPRMAFPMKHWKSLDQKVQQTTLDTATTYLDQIENL